MDLPFLEALRGTERKSETRHAGGATKNVHTQIAKPRGKHFQAHWAARPRHALNRYSHVTRLLSCDFQLPPSFVRATKRQENRLKVTYIIWAPPILVHCLVWIGIFTEGVGDFDPWPLFSFVWGGAGCCFLCVGLAKGASRFSWLASPQRISNSPGEICDSVETSLA